MMKLWIMKIIYANCGVKNYMKEDHRSYNRRNFCSRAKKKNCLRYLFTQQKLADKVVIDDVTSGRKDMDLHRLLPAVQGWMG